MKAERNLELEVKELRLDLIDLLSLSVDVSKAYIPYMYLYENELRALVGASKAEKTVALEHIVAKVISSYKRDYKEAEKCKK